MSNEVNVSLWATAVIGINAPPHQWFLDISPNKYSQTLRRVRTYSAVPYVPFDDDSGSGPDRPLGIPDAPFPTFEQRVAVTEVFHLLKGTPPAAPNVPHLQINVVVTSLTPGVPVTYQLYVAETDN